MTNLAYELRFFNNSKKFYLLYSVFLSIFATCK